MKISTILACIILALSGCDGDSHEPKASSKIVFIDSSPQACSGEGQFLCLKLREDSQDSYSIIYDGITDFTHSFGHSYMLEIEELAIENPPQDGSSIERKLVRMISDIEDEIGTEYTLNFNTNIDTLVSKNDSQYSVLDQWFDCSVLLDCNPLLSLDSNSTDLTLIFQYLGDSSIELIAWGQIQ